MVLGSLSAEASDPCVLLPGRRLAKPMFLCVANRGIVRRQDCSTVCSLCLSVLEVSYRLGLLALLQSRRQQTRPGASVTSGRRPMAGR
jgi:hypothetical protein